MDHERLKDALFAYRDGELDEAGRREVAAHLAACADCRGALERWELAAKALLEPPRVEAREAFVGGVMARIAEEEREAEAPSGAGWWLTPGFALALGLAVLLWPQAAPSVDQLLLSEAPSWAVDGGLDDDEVLALVIEEAP